MEKLDDRFSEEAKMLRRIRLKISVWPMLRWRTLMRPESLGLSREPSACVRPNIRQTRRLLTSCGRCTCLTLSGTRRRRQECYCSGVTYRDRFPRHLNHGAGVHSRGAAADDVDEIPNTVIAEAVNNAIAHRNYASIGSIQVEVYSDRVEVISPGRIHRAITVAELYKKHESFATNPRIARAMYQVKYIETIGTGLTDLLKECKAKGLRKPLLEEVSGRFRIVIWRPKAVANRGGNTLKGSLKGSLKSSQKIIEVLTKDPHCTYDSLAEIIGISRRAVTKQIQRLRQSGRLRRIGPDKGGHWEILSRQV